MAERYASQFFPCAVGRTQQKRPETAAGETNFAERMQQMENQKTKPRYNMLQTCGFMIRTAWQEKEKKVLVLSALTAVIAVSSNLADLYISPLIVNAVETQAPVSRLLTIILAFIALCMFLNSSASYINTNIIYGKVTLRLAVMSLLNTKQLTTSYPNKTDTAFLKMISKTEEALGSNSGSAEAIWATLTNLLRNVAGFLIYLTLLSVVNPLLILIITAATLAGYFINKPLREYDYRHREETGACYQRLSLYRNYSESDGLAKDIRLFGMRPWLEEIYSKTAAALTAYRKKEQTVYLWGSVADLILAFLRNGAIYAYLISMILNGELTLSLFLLYFTAAGNFSAWVTGILNDLLTLHRQSLDISIIMECLEYPEPFLFEKGLSLVPDPKGKYELRLENVSFRYPEADKDTLSHVSLTLRPGEKLAVVGLNGAGKTTLIKLLCGFLDPTEGKVLLNGRDIREYNRKHYYRLFSAVFQEFCIIPGSVATNVAQQEDGIDLDRVKDCLDKAGLTEKILSLPDRYEAKLNREIYDDATNLSGGETQRLMLARALYKDAPFVILDEPTAALDPLAEADIYGKYNEMTMGRSSVYISHRLASTRFCDRIILIENGTIAEEGTHAQLLSRSGRYAELFRTQSKYYQDV